jgi:hypothetical protein
VVGTQLPPTLNRYLAFSQNNRGPEDTKNTVSSANTSTSSLVSLDKEDISDSIRKLMTSTAISYHPKKEKPKKEKRKPFLNFDNFCLPCEHHEFT